MSNLVITKYTDRISSLYKDKATSFLILGDEKAMLIDTGHGTYRVDEEVKKLTDLPLIVVNTHAHPDHAGGDAFFDEIYVHPLARTQLSDHKGLIDIMNGDIFDLGGIKFTAIYTPGHTPDGVSFVNYEDGYIFTGDIIEEGHVSIRDLNGYIYSIELLLSMKDKIDTIYPSHGTCPIKLGENIEDVLNLLVGIRDDTLERIPMKLGPPPDAKPEDEETPPPPGIDPDAIFLGYKYKYLTVMYDPNRSGWD